jgi:toxin CcdB
MAQFDVFTNPSPTTREHFPYVVDIQSPYLDELATRIVIPLGKASAFANTSMQGLTPKISFHGEKLLLLTPQISSIPKNKLGDPIGTLAHFRSEIMNALDFAIVGI